eukprot:gene25221-biopygen1432
MMGKWETRRRRRRKGCKEKKMRKGGATSAAKEKKKQRRCSPYARYALSVPFLERDIVLLSFPHIRCLFTHCGRKMGHSPHLVVSKRCGKHEEMWDKIGNSPHFPSRQENCRNLRCG